MAKIGEFLDSLYRQIEGDSDARIFFDCFLRESLVIELNKHTEGGSVDLEMDIADKRTWKAIYIIAAEILWDAASRNHSEVHPDIFQEANSLSLAFCQEIEKCLGNNMEFIPIESPTEMMAKEGLVKIEGGYVKFTPKGGQMAKKIEEQFKEPE